MSTKFQKAIIVICTLIVMILILEFFLRYLSANVQKKTTYEINELGFRGPAYSKKKTDEVYRIIAVGDSFTYGAAAPYEATYTHQLEALLNDRNATEFKYEVLNLGYPGYDPTQEMEILIKSGFDLEPDLVIIGYNLNDISDITPTAEQNENAFLMFLIRRSHLFRMSYFTIRRWLNPSYAGIIGRSDNINEMYQEDNPNWIKCQKIIKQMVQLIKDHNAEIIIIILPHIRPFGDKYPFQPAVYKVESFCKENNIPVVNILPLLKGIDPVTLRAHKLDAHPNEKYYSIAAEALKEYLIEKQYVR